MARTQGSYLTDLRGLSRLVIDATTGVTDIVEGMHHTIERVPGVRDRPSMGRTRGITGLVYRSVRTVTSLVGSSLDLVLAQIAPLLDDVPDAPERVHALGVLNGIFGDYLEQTDNPLAIPMDACVGGRALDLEAPTLAAALPAATPRVLVLVHGLCMNDLLWRRGGHDHGEALARDLGYTAVYVRYSSGRHVSQNGRELADLLDALVARWPVPVEEIALLGHSMGGLVARSAVHYAERTSRDWRPRLRHLAFLGTPHQGAPLERGGSWLHLLARVSPYTFPLARLGNIRSAGITDLRFGNLVDSDWLGVDRFVGRGDPRLPVPLPSDVACHAIAGDLLARAVPDPGDALGDGLVPVPSALGRHPDPARQLAFAESDLRVLPGVGHLELLGSTEAFEALRGWLGS